MTGPAPSSGDADEFARRRAIAHQYYRIADLVRASRHTPLWLPDGGHLLFWAPSGPDSSDLVAYDPASGRRDILLSGVAFRALLGIARVPGDLRMALDAEGAVLFEAGEVTHRLHLASRTLEAVPAGSPEKHMLDSVASPDRHRFAHVRDGELTVRDTAGALLCKQSGRPDYSWTIFPEGWSPDSRLLVATRLDERPVHKIPVVTFGALETVAMKPYSKSGTPLAIPEHFLIAPAEGKIVPVDLPRSEGYDFVAGWSRGGSEALILRMTREGKRLDLWAVASDGSARLVLREENPDTFVAALQFIAGDWRHRVTILSGDRGILWISDRDGWQHLYHYDSSGALVRKLTDGNRTIHSVLHVTAAGEVYLLGSEDGGKPYDRLLYRATLDGGEIVPLSPADGIHEISFSPCGRFYLDAHSARTRPRTFELVTVDGGHRAMIARADVSGLEKLGHIPPEAFTAVAADGVTRLHGAIFRPNDFDTALRYPIINLVYAGPWIAILPWGYAGSERGFGDALPWATEAHAMAQMGFVVVLVDGRGTPGRGKQFLDVTYGRVGQIEIADQVTAIRQAAATRPYMDIDRVGVVGHSWGGYFALRAMLTAPDFYRAGYAGASGALDELAQINEPNLGLRAVNPEAYALGSNPALAGNLRGALKMMHGTSDMNATLSTTMRMAEALIAAGKHFEMLIMPGQPHGPVPPANLYYFDDKALFFTRHLGGPVDR